MRALTPAERASCARGETAGVARMFMAVLRQVHSRPAERNVYLNPQRADQALVFIPQRWVPRPLDETTQTIFSRVRDALDEVEEEESGTRFGEAVAGARQIDTEKMPQLARASKKQMSAHLESVRLATASGDDWLGHTSAGEGVPAFFGKEMAGRLSAKEIIPALEVALGVHSPDDITDEKSAEIAAKAVVEMSRRMLHGAPRNLTVIANKGDPGAVYVHEHAAGWTPRTREEAGRGLFKRAAEALAMRLSAAVYDAPESARALAPLRPWLGERLSELGSSELGQLAAGIILDRYLRSADWYYPKQAPSSNPYDRREAARKLLCEESRPAVCGPPVLDDGDLAAILGFEL